MFRVRVEQLIIRVRVPTRGLSRDVVILSYNDNNMLYLDIPAPRKTRSVSGLYFFSATRFKNLLRKKLVFSLRITSHCTEGYLDKKSAHGSTMEGGGMTGWWCINNKPYSV